MIYINDLYDLMLSIFSWAYWPNMFLCEVCSNLYVHYHWVNCPYYWIINYYSSYHTFIQIILFLALWWITFQLLAAVYIYPHIYMACLSVFLRCLSKSYMSIFMKSNFSFFSFVLCLLCSKKTMANPNFQIFFLLFYIFNTTIMRHFKLTFVYCVC